MADLAQSGSNPERAARYRAEAQKYRDRAETEPIIEIKFMMLELARQYDDLADRLGTLSKSQL
jgi:hypothetical protein